MSAQVSSRRGGPPPADKRDELTAPYDHLVIADGST
jgi:hypothetical protein